MAGSVPAGSEVTSGTYTCLACGYKFHVALAAHLPPCPSCGSSSYHTASGGDAASEPEPVS